ncbi:MAG: hypothetical protein B7Z60_04445 [Ferrovum sp. 37-45-19]|nr:MAG: hypothetical protein B7Z60_04445 [Ferrovum sp. 37-45-19]
MKKTIKILPWNNMFLLDIPVIDIQHRKLFELINEFVYELTFDDVDDTESLLALLDNLYEYCNYHFITEEKVWAQKNINKELIDEHHHEHNLLFGKVSQYKEKLATLETGFITSKYIYNEIIPFLVKWLSFHILEKDRFLAVIAKNLELKKEPDDAFQRAQKTLENKAFYLSLYVELYVSCFKSLAKISHLIENKGVIKEISNHKDDYFKHIINNAVDPIWTVNVIDYQLVEHNISLVKFCEEHLGSATSYIDYALRFKIYYEQLNNKEKNLIVDFYDDKIDRYLLISFSYLEKDQFFASDEICVFVRDVTDNKKNIEISNHLFFYDSLTNLPNRKFLLERLRLVYENSKISDKYSALIIFDIDNFHLINDKFGSATADDILFELRNRLMDLLKNLDNVARIGADSFSVLQIDISKDKNRALANTIELSEQINSILNIPFELKENRFRISISINFDFMQLLGFGEAAQIHSKKEGLNRLNFYQHELQQIAINNLLIENELKFAIPNQLKIYYQVQHGPNNQNVGCEALIRWDHPTKGVISPDHFITIAEDCGLILSIGYWLFDQVFYQLSLWNKHPNPMYNVPVSLNLSVKQFNDPNLVSHLHDLLKKYQISASLITLEITETIMMENFECFKKIFKILKSFGYMLSLDDFGIGYSSLSVISEIDFDEIKIDKSFINNIVSSSKSQTIVKLIVALAEELSVRIVAEGVEDEKQYEILKSYGVGCFQGFLFSLPRPAEDFK